MYQRGVTNLMRAGAAPGRTLATLQTSCSESARAITRVTDRSGSMPISTATCQESRRYYDRKRAEGKTHTQAVLVLARRRVNVLWALIRDNRTYQAAPPRHASTEAA